MSQSRESEPTEKEQEILLGLFKAYLEDLGRIGSRHEALRQFYISVISALFVFLAMTGEKGLFQAVRGGVLVLVAIVGITVSIAWFLHMWSFGTLYVAKKATLSQMEATLPFKPFSTETTELAKGRRLRLTIVDRIVAVAFIALFLTLAFFKAGE